MRRGATAALLLLLAGLTAPATAGTGDARPRTPPLPRLKVDPKALELMALNMYQEASGEGAEGMLAVGWVVLNRLRDPRFPKTVADVITHGGSVGPCQWSWYCDGRPEKPYGRSWRLAQKLARQILQDPPPDPTNGAIWFQLSYTDPPPWRARLVARLGEHDFYGR